MKIQIKNVEIQANRTDYKVENTLETVSEEHQVSSVSFFEFAVELLAEIHKEQQK